MRQYPNYDQNIIGKNLKRLREANGFSHDDVRQYLWLASEQSIYQYETGKKLPSAVGMLALMDLYGANLNDIVREHEGDEKSSSVFKSFFI